MTDLTITVPVVQQGVVLLLGDGTNLIVTDTTPLEAVLSLVDGPIARAVTVARLRAIADAIDSAG